MQLQKYFKKQRISTTKFLTIKPHLLSQTKKTFTQNKKKKHFHNYFSTTRFFNQ